MQSTSSGEPPAGARFTSRSLNGCPDCKVSCMWASKLSGNSVKSSKLRPRALLELTLRTASAAAFRYKTSSDSSTQTTPTDKLPIRSISSVSTDLSMQSIPFISKLGAVSAVFRTMELIQKTYIKQQLRSLLYGAEKQQNGVNVFNGVLRCMIAGERTIMVQIVRQIANV